MTRTAGDKSRREPLGWGTARGTAGFALLVREGARGGELRWKDVFFSTFSLAPTFSRGGLKTREPPNPLCCGRPRRLPVPTGGEHPSKQCPAAAAPHACCGAAEPMARPHGATRFGDRRKLFCLHRA